MIESVEERRIWDLLARNFFWRVPADFVVKVLGRSNLADSAPVRLQIFEIAVASIFAHLRPEYDWYVTPNLPDGGLDFVGKGRFLEDADLGIAAAITVGGQCKKRSHVTDIVSEISGSLARMSNTINPTFFVVALSARVTRSRLINARRILEDAHRRHCHILDRGQIEGLIRDHFLVVDQILRESLAESEIQEVRNYFAGPQIRQSESTMEAVVPAKVLAGVPFAIQLNLRSPLLALRGTRLSWKPVGDDTNRLGDPRVMLIGPIGADSEAGIECKVNSLADDPLSAQISLELISYSVGRLNLGEAILGQPTDVSVGGTKVSLGQVQVVENIRPRFFERPFRSALARLSMEYDRALTGMVACVAVVGAGGSGKSRLCEEFSLEKRRRGCHVVQAKQTKTLNDPNRVLADLLIGLAAANVPIDDPAAGVINVLSQYDPNLAKRAEPAIRSIIGMREKMPGSVNDQDVLSSLLVLILVRTRWVPLIIHLQDLHWCTADALLSLERLVWQLEIIQKSGGGSRHGSTKGVLFILEGRIWESHDLGANLWSTRTFETFLERIGCPKQSCPPFDPTDSLEFVRRLFEDRHSARPLIDPSLLELQNSLVERIHRTAGGNPFHTLEQIQLLKERRILGQNPETGLLYMIQPAREEPLLPTTVFDSINLRWQYIKSRKPALAMLLWAASLLEDRVSSPLFRHLWRGIGPDLTLAEIDAAEFLWTGDGEQAEVFFRHENYFQSLRRLELAPAERQRIVGIYADWFVRFPRLDSTGKFRWARILMGSPAPDSRKIHSLLRTSLAGAQNRGDLVLARRILTALLDFTWIENAQAAIRMPAFLRCCDDEISLCRSLLNSDRTQAAQRIDRLRERIREKLSFSDAWTLETTERLHFRLLAGDILQSQILFNDRQAARASEIAGEVVRCVRALRSEPSATKSSDWQTLEMEALHSYAVALALGGEITAAIEASEQAVAIARMAATPSSFDVLSTHANILLAKELEAPESILRECMAQVSSQTVARETQDAIVLNLSMTLILGAHRLKASDESRANVKLDEASTLLKPIFANSFRLGRYPDAGAAALLLGIISALRNSANEVSWFAQAVTASARGGQIETLWRSHIDLATSLHRRNQRVGESVRDHARAALQILEETLVSYPRPDRSARFDLVRIPLAHAVRFLIQSGDEAGLAALERYPALRSCFQEPERGVLRQDRGGYRSHEWLSIGEWDYVIY
jgi:hypothetical protein